jgi:cation transport ATPase
MDEIAPPDRRKKWFLWGLLLTGISLIPVVIGFVHSLRGVSENQASGLAVVATGFVQVYSVFGLILASLLPFAAIVLLAKSFAEGRRSRSFLAVVCICCCALMLAIPAWVAWSLLNS